jgi:hypothetical protein
MLKRAAGGLARVVDKGGTGGGVESDGNSDS